MLKIIKKSAMNPTILKVLNDFAEITSVIESKGGEQPKRANLEGVNAKKGRK